MDILIRNVEPAAVKKLGEMAKKKGVSREKFLRTYIENLSVIGEMREMEERYASLVKEVATVIASNTAALNEMKRRED